MAYDRYKKRMARAQADSMDLGNLGSILDIADRDGPRQQVADRLQLQQLQDAMFSSQMNRQFMPQERQAPLDAMQSEQAFLGELRPEQLAMLRHQITSAGMENDLFSKTFGDRVAQQSATTQSAQAEADFAGRTLPDRVQAASFAPLMAQRQAEGAGLQNAGQGIENQARLRMNQEAAEMFPWTKQAAQGQAIQSMLGAAMGAPSGQATEDGQAIPMQLDAPAMFKQAGIPIMPARGRMNPGQQVDAGLAEGMFPQGDQRGIDPAMLQQLMHSINADSEWGWTEESRAIQEVMNNPQAYGFSYMDAGQLTPEIIQQVIAAMQAEGKL